MVRVLVLWTISTFPPCRHHVFLSHCQEDRGELAIPLYQQLNYSGVRPWLDRHHYPYGRGSRDALRSGILDCRHVVFLITDAMLSKARGWCLLELAYSEIVQDNLVVHGTSLLDVILPLFFVKQTNKRLPRSVWQFQRDRGVFLPSSTDPVAWACGQIMHFLRRERSLAEKIGRLAESDSNFRDTFLKKPDLAYRVTKFLPKLRLP